MLPSLWLLPLAAALGGPAPAPPLTTLSGHLAHAPAGDTVRVWVGNERLKAPLSAAGDFQLAVPGLKQNTPVELSYGGQRTRCYLMPGDQLQLTLDFKDFDKTIAYSGRGSAANNYLAHSLYQFAYGPPSGGLLRVGDMPPGTPAEAQQAAAALRQARRTYLATYAKAHPLPAAFVHDEQVIIDADWANQLLLYAYRHRTSLPPDYYGFLKQVPMREISQHYGRSIVDNSLLANIVTGYSARLLPSGQLSTDPAEGPRLYQLATQELGTGRALNWEMQNILFAGLGTNLAGAQTFYQTFRLHNADSTIAHSYREAIARQLRLRQGQPAPVFTLLDNTGKSVSLSDFRGKVVYLDFWGTWCGPCMREMSESAPALKKQFEGRDVVFLYVSVGDPEAKWQQTIVDKQFGSSNSVHLRAPDSKLAQEYLVNGYPSYYLIGRDGRMVQPWTVRPSEGAKTVAAIEAALQP